MYPPYWVSSKEGTFHFSQSAVFSIEGDATVKPAAAWIDGLKIRQALLAGTEPN